MSEHTQVIFATVVFIVTYVVIVSEKIHRTVAALIGAALVVVFSIVHPGEATEAIDFNTIGLLVGTPGGYGQLEPSLVGVVPGGLSGWQRDRYWRFGQCGGDWHGRKAWTSHYLYRFFQSSFPVDAVIHRHIDGIPVVMASLRWCSFRCGNPGNGRDIGPGPWFSSRFPGTAFGSRGFDG